MRSPTTEARDCTQVPANDPADPAISPAAGLPASGSDERTVFAIGELAEEFAITTRAIRFYEARGLLAPARSGTARSYSRRDRARLMLILRGKNLGFTLEDIGEYLALYDEDPSQMTQTSLLLDKVERHIADLQQKRVDLDRALGELKDIRLRCETFLTANGPRGAP